MKSKLVAMAALIIIAATSEYLLLKRRFRPYSDTIATRFAAELLPPAIGSFRSAQRWRNPLGGHRSEIGATYRDADGAEANLDIKLGEWEPHNGVNCWLVRGDPMLGQRLSTVETANANALFDLALFRDDAGITLMASTECYSDGCRESLIPASNAGGLRLPPFREPAAAPVAVSIVVREPNDLPEKSSPSREDRLLRTFTRFAAQLDLSPLLEPVSRKINQAQR